MTQKPATGSTEPLATGPAGRGDFTLPADCVAAYGFDPRKTWPFMIMLLVLSVISVTRVVLYGFGENWLPTFVLLAFPIIALIMVGRELRMRGPIVVISQSGLLDRRQGPETVPWDQIAEAEIKKRPFLRAIRIKLTNGERYDLELMLLRAEPMPIMQAIRDHAEAATAHMEPESSRRWW